MALDDRPLIACTFHPETLSDATPEQALRPLFDALDALPQVQVIFTKANADAGGRGSTSCSTPTSPGDRRACGRLPAWDR